MTTLARPQSRASLTPSVFAVYAAGLLQGLTLVSFPALSSVLKLEFGLSDAEYGTIFLPQVAMAVLGAIVGGALTRRLGLKVILVLALLANAASQALLAASVSVGSGAAYPVILLGTACLGLGFGLFGGPINAYPPRFFPAQSTTAVVAAHSLIGFGLAVGPIAAGLFIGVGWAGFPLLLTAAALAVAGTCAVLPLPDDAGRDTAPGGEQDGSVWTDRRFWLFAGIIVLYAFAEGTFSNWVVLYLNQARGLPEMSAGLALSAFWASVVAGRLLVSVLVLRIPPRVIWLTLPVLMIAAFLLLPSVDGAATGVAYFALAGLACSAFLPLTITLASEQFPHAVAKVSSLLIAALMLGAGLSAFLIGLLRATLSFETLYLLSAAYPVAVIALAAIVLRMTAKRP